MPGAEPPPAGQGKRGSTRQKRHGHPSRTGYGHLPLEKIQRDLHVWNISGDTDEPERTSDSLEHESASKTGHTHGANGTAFGGLGEVNAGNKLNEAVPEVRFLSE